MTRTITKSIQLFVCLALSLAFTQSIAQTSGGPDLYGYIWRDSNDPNGPVYNWIDITSFPNTFEVTGLADDNIRGPYTIGFPFHFYWYDVTTFRVGSNGYLGFGLGSAAHPFPLIPTPTGLQNFVAGMMSDLTFTDDGGNTINTAKVWYWTNPTNDTLIVSYLSVPFWDPNPPGYIGENTFQFIFSAVDSSITLQYNTQNGVYNNPTNFSTIGIENISGNIGLQHSHDVLPPTSYAIKFYYPSTTTYQVDDASVVYNNNVITGGLFRSVNGSPYVMEAQIKNTGNQPLASFNVMSRVVNYLNQNQALDNIASSPLNPGDVENLSFPNTFTPTVAGTYRHITNTQLTGDATPSNNSKELELVAVDTTQTSIELSFDTGVDAGLGGLGWQGGGGGAAIQFVPPFYPCNITQLSAFIAGNANLAGFAMMIMDDNGPGGSALSVLDSIWVDGAAVITGAWNIVPVTSTVTIDSGSFYVAWMMGADGISLGQNQVQPISNRTYEVLGLASNPTSWADYRYREIEDLMINAYIEEVPVGITEPGVKSFIGNFYPNPSGNTASIDYSLPENAGELSWEIVDLNGKLVNSGVTSQLAGTLRIDTYNLQNGIYLCTLKAGNESVNKKLSIVK